MSQEHLQSSLLTLEQAWVRSKADGGGRRVCAVWECRSARETPIFLLLCTMKNGRQIRTRLAEKRLKLDSSSLYYEVAPTGPAPAHCVSRCSRCLTVTSPSCFAQWSVNRVACVRCRSWVLRLRQGSIVHSDSRDSASSAVADAVLRSANESRNMLHDVNCERD